MTECFHLGLHAQETLPLRPLHCGVCELWMCSAAATIQLIPVFPSIIGTNCVELISSFFQDSFSGGMRYACLPVTKGRSFLATLP